MDDINVGVSNYSYNHGFEGFKIMGLMRFYHNYMKLLLKYRSSGTLLDVGAGRGEFIDLAGSYFNVTGVDIKPTREDILWMDVEEQLPQGEWDVITCWAVLEHLERPARTFKRLMTSLKSGGLVIIHTTNKLSLSYALQRENWAWFGEGHVGVDLFDELYLKRLFKQNNVKVLEISKYNFVGKRGKLGEAIFNSRYSPVRFLVDKLGVGDLITMVGEKQ